MPRRHRRRYRWPLRPSLRLPPLPPDEAVDLTASPFVIRGHLLAAASNDTLRDALPEIEHQEHGERRHRAGCAPHHGTVGFFGLAVAALHILVRFPALALLHRYACGTAMWSPADPTNAPICWLPCVLHYQNWLLAWAFVDLAKLDWAGQHGGGRGKAIADAPHGFFPLLHRVHRHRVFGFVYRTQQVKVIKED